MYRTGNNGLECPFNYTSINFSGFTPLLYLHEEKWIESPVGASEACERTHAFDHCHLLGFHEDYVLMILFSFLWTGL